MKKLYYTVRENSRNKKEKRTLLVEVELIERKGNGIAEVCTIRPIKGFGEITVKESTLKLL